MSSRATEPKLVDDGDPPALERNATAPPPPDTNASYTPSDSTEPILQDEKKGGRDLPPERQEVLDLVSPSARTSTLSFQASTRECTEGGVNTKCENAISEFMEAVGTL